MLLWHAPNQQSAVEGVEPLLVLAASAFDFHFPMTPFLTGDQPAAEGSSAAASAPGRTGTTAAGGRKREAA